MIALPAPPGIDAAIDASVARIFARAAELVLQDLAAAAEGRIP